MRNTLRNHYFKQSTLITIRETLTIVALVIGAAWAVYTFIATHQMQRADLEVTQLNQQVIPVINVQIQAKPWATAQAGDTIQVAVTLTNAGRYRATLDLTQQPFRVYPVQFAQDTAQASTALGWLPVPTAPWRTGAPDFPRAVTHLQLLPGEQQRLTWLYRVPEPRLYYVEFRVRLSQDSQQLWHNTGIDLHQLEWSDGVYVEVPRPTGAAASRPVGS